VIEGAGISSVSASTAELSLPAVSQPLRTTSAETKKLPPVQDPGFPPSAPLGQKIAMLLAVTLPFAGVIIAIVLTWQHGFMGWLYLSLLLSGWAITGMGITIGFHRLLTHRSFETYRWLRAAWLFTGALSVEGSPLVWCAIHRRHHQFSDLPGDPHSPHLAGDGWLGWWRGFWHSHAGWLFTGLWSQAEMQRYIPDLLADPWLVKLDKLYGLWILISFIIPFAIGGLVMRSWEGAWLGLLWGGFVRVFVTHHVTWSINSVCHLFGQREFVSDDHSRNNWLCGLLAWGEGWHNNHHAFPTSARHGLRWWQFDTSWVVIRTMQLLGLAWNVRIPSEQAMSDKRLAN
jgi:stearoyl-CoA desaturase (delta-9 desaturase)